MTDDTACPCGDAHVDTCQGCPGVSDTDYIEWPSDPNAGELRRVEPDQRLRAVQQAAKEAARATIPQMIVLSERGPYVWPAFGRRSGTGEGR